MNHIFKKKCHQTLPCKSYESEAKFKYFGKPLTNQNSTNEEIKNRLNSDVYYHSVQNLLSSSLLSRSITIKQEELQFCLLLHRAQNLVSHTEKGIKADGV